MTIDLANRRSIRKISSEDFAAYPIWEWAINEEETQGLGESLLRPTSLDSIPRTTGRQYIVSATALLSDGSALQACAGVGIRSGKAQVEPLFMFLQERHLDFSGAETDTVLSHYIRRPGARVVAWELAVPLAGDEKRPKGKVRRSLKDRLAALWKRTPSRSPIAGGQV